MASWRPDFNPKHLYFITTKAVDHVHLFQRDVVKRLLVDALDCMRLRNQMTLYVFVIMPNHVHLIIRYPSDSSVEAIIRDYKRHTSDRIIRYYEAENNHEALEFLAGKVSSDKQKYKVWEDGYNIKNIFSVKFLTQKIIYIHNNPCQPHWNLASSPEEYIWSSARFYLRGERAIIPVEDVRKLMV